LPTSTVTAAWEKCPAAPTQGATVLPPFAEAAKRLIGVWVMCPSSASATSTLAPYAGLALHPDGSFEKLSADPSDHFAPAAECNGSGLWGLDTGQSNQVNLYIDAGQMILLWSEDASAQTALVLQDMVGTINVVHAE